MASKRSGSGGNASRNPQGNRSAQQRYVQKFGKSTKACTGLLHFDGGEVPIENFRQATQNKSTFLQSRCDTCNRLYFAVQQKPIKRVAAYVIYAISTNPDKWIKEVPNSLTATLNELRDYYLGLGCSLTECKYANYHGDYRKTASKLTELLKGKERAKKDSFIIDERTKLRHPAPQILHDLQVWAGRNGSLWNCYSGDTIWKWWQDFFCEDTAYCSEELNESKLDKTFLLVEHPLSDFSWGAGNIKDSIQGHSVPAFNQVKSSASVLPSTSNVGSRVYGYLCEGDHLAMARFARECKEGNKSLGHSPAPLRWLGKNDPINGKPESLSENVQKRDSLRDLYEIAVGAPQKASSYVSWQIADLVVELGSSHVTYEFFQQAIESAVEEYFDGLAVELDHGDDSRLLNDLVIADPGKTEIVYKYRREKLAAWLPNRPSYRRKKNLRE